MKTVFDRTLQAARLALSLALWSATLLGTFANAVAGTAVPDAQDAQDTLSFELERTPPETVRLVPFATREPREAPDSTAARQSTRAYRPREDIRQVRDAFGHSAASNSTRLEIALLVSLSIPDEALRAIASDAAKLGLPLVLRGMPVKEKRVEGEANADHAKRPVVANGYLKQRISPLAELGGAVSVDPTLWRETAASLRAKGDASAAADLPVPLLVLRLFDTGVSIDSNGSDVSSPSSPETLRTVEVIPGEVRPLYALAWAARHAASPDIRTAVRERLRERGCLDEAERLLP